MPPRLRPIRRPLVTSEHGVDGAHPDTQLPSDAVDMLARGIRLEDQLLDLRCSARWHTGPSRPTPRPVKDAPGARHSRLGRDDGPCPGGTTRGPAASLSTLAPSTPPLGIPGRKQSTNGSPAPPVRPPATVCDFRPARSLWCGPVAASGLGCRLASSDDRTPMQQGPPPRKECPVCGGRDGRHVPGCPVDRRPPRRFRTGAAPWRPSRVASSFITILTTTPASTGRVALPSSHGGGAHQLGEDVAGNRLHVATDVRFEAFSGSGRRARSGPPARG